MLDSENHDHLLSLVQGDELSGRSATCVPVAINLSLALDTIIVRTFSSELEFQGIQQL